MFNSYVSHYQRVPYVDETSAAQGLRALGDSTLLHHVPRRQRPHTIPDILRLKKTHNN